jgi:hypothetical protein
MSTAAAATYRIGTQHAANPENAPAEPLGADSDGVEFLQAMGVLRQRMVPKQALAFPQSSRFAQRWDAVQARDHSA